MKNKIKEFCKFKRIAKKLSKTEWDFLKQFCHNKGIIQAFYSHGTDTLKEWSEYVATKGFHTRLQKYVETRANPIHSQYLIKHSYTETFIKYRYMVMCEIIHRLFPVSACTF